jgi:hypothetical protein
VTCAIAYFAITILRVPSFSRVLLVEKKDSKEMRVVGSGLARIILGPFLLSQILTVKVKRFSKTISAAGQVVREVNKALARNIY